MSEHDHEHEPKAEELERVKMPDPPSEMDHYKTLLAQKHDRSVTGSDCDSYSPSTTKVGENEVAVYCETCNFVMDRKELQPEEDDE